jgi:hypothetical protein
MRPYNEITSMHPNQPTKLITSTAIGSLFLISIAAGIVSTTIHHTDLPTINTSSKQQTLGSSTTSPITTSTPSSAPSNTATAHVTSSTPTASHTTHSNSTATTSTTPPTDTTSTNTQPSTQTAPANNTPNSPTPPSNNQTVTITVPYVVSRTNDNVWVPDPNTGAEGYWDAQCSITWSDGKTMTWNVGPPTKSEMGTLAPPGGASICTSPELQSPRPQ